MGERGADGVGVLGARVVDGDLVLRMSDGSERNAGHVVGPKGRDGVDGKSVDLDAVTRAVSLEVRRAVAEIPPPKDGRDGMAGKDGTPGRDGAPGKDGISREDLEATAMRMLDDMLSRATISGRTLTLGKRQFELPAMVWQGLWKEGADYRAGDVVTRGGSAWICQETGTSDQPGMGTGAWGLMVRHGRA